MPETRGVVKWRRQTSSPLRPSPQQTTTWRMSSTDKACSRSLRQWTAWPTCLPTTTCIFSPVSAKERPVTTEMTTAASTSRGLLSLLSCLTCTPTRPHPPLLARPRISLRHRQARRTMRRHATCRAPGSPTNRRPCLESAPPRTPTPLPPPPSPPFPMRRRSSRRGYRFQPAPGSRAGAWPRSSSPSKNSRRVATRARAATWT